MKGIVYTSKFKKDLRRLMKANPRAERILRSAIEDLRAGRDLPPRMKNHPLQGSWNDHWDCHLKPDLVLIYRTDEEDVTLVRVGSHSELF